MFVLYQRFIEQAKQTDIEQYNIKHQEYLVRSGKVKKNARGQEMKTQKQAANRPTGERELTRKGRETRQRDVPAYKEMLEVQEKPIKGAQTYNFDMNEQAEILTQPPKAREKQRGIQVKSTAISKQERNIQQSQKITKQTIENQPPAAKRTESISERRAPEPAVEDLEEHAEVQLIECPQNCGRKFNLRALEKHVKICQKGEQKRKVYKVKVVDEQAEKLKKNESVVPAKKKKEELVPKWKKESEQLRNQIQNKQVVDDRTECPGCGRKFNEDAASRHITKCLQRNTMKR